METSAGDPIRSSSSRLLVLMFTDLVDSTALKARIGIEDYQPLKARHDQFIRQALSAAPTGKVLQDTGDGYFISFDSIGHAIGAALVFQWLMAQEAWPHPFQTRVGLHLGEVEQRHNEVTGQPGFVASAIDLASRTMSLARGGQILLTRSVFDAARQVVRHHPSPGPDAPLPTLKWMAHGPYLFKGSTEPIEVFEVGAESVAPLVPPPDSEKAKRHIRPGDEETLGWRPAVNRSLENAPNWILTEKLGEGGFGEVWLAEQIKTHAKRVFKFCFDPERLRALKREVVLFRLLKEALGDRRDIAAVKDWQFDRAPYFIELDYCPAGNLSDWAAAQGGIEKVPLEKRLTLVAQIAEALSAAHSVGILHKDIKPSNVLMMVDTDGWFYPRLSDFGIGILTDRSRLASFNITAIGFTALNIEINDSSRTGTRMYSPPESLLDRPHTVQGDVYALGVLLYQLAVGDLHRPLAVGWERDIADDLLRQDVAAALEGTPSRRLASSAELVTRLRTIQKRRSTIEIQRRSVELGRLAARRKRLLVGSGITMALLILVIIGFAFLLTQVRRQEQVAENNLGEAVAAKNIAREAEIKARSRLIANLVDHGFEYQNTGDPSLALLYFIHVLELDADTPAITLNERIRIRAALELAGRPVSAFGDEATHFHALIGSGLEATADGRKLQWRGKNEAMILNRDGRPVTTPLVHRSYVQDAAFSPDGTRVVTASQDQTARVWDAATGQPVTPSLKHDSTVWHATFSPDGTRIVTVSADHCARVWDATSGLPLTPPLHHEGGVNEALFSPDGSRVVTSSRDGTARVWDAGSGEPVAPALKHANEVSHAAFSRDGTRVVTASADGTARVWDAGNGEPVTPALKHENEVNYAAFSPDGTRVVTASSDQTARVWDANNGKPLTPPLKHEDWLSYAVFSPDGSRIVTASHDKTVRVWDVATFEPLTPPLKHDERVNQAVFCPDGTLLITSDGKSMRVWDATSSRPITTQLKHGGSVWHAAFSPDGTRIVTASDDHIARVWDVASGRPLTPPLQHERGVNEALFSPDGGRVITGSDDKTARVWDANTGQPVTPPLNHDREVLGAAFSLDGMRVVTASRDQTACVWDATSGQPLTPPLKHNGTVLQAAFSPDGTRIVTASDDRTARVWDAASGLPVTPPLKHTATVWHAHFSPDGTRVVTASEDQTARVWDATSGQPLTPPIRHDRAITDATFSPDGTRIVTASHDQSARIWDAANGQPLTAPMKHQSAVWRASFSPDGTRIVSASADKTARVWDANSGQPLTPPMKHDADVRSAEFSPDGSRIVTASVDWIARVWDIGPATQPVADLKAHAEIISLRTIDETGGVMPLGPGEFQSRWDRLTAKYPQEFFPPPNLELVDEAMKSKVMSPVLVAELGKWFDKKQQHAGAEKLLDFARQRGAPIDAALLARSHWQAGELSAAAIEFKIAIEQRDPVKDVAERKYLQVCLAAVEREARLEAAAVTATDYWWSTTWKPAGPRLWRKLDAETWQETDPSGAMKIFSIVSMGDPKLGTGLVVRCKADPDLEVWIPKLIEGNQTYYRRAKEDKNWHGMGGIHPGARPATPPTTQPTTATHP